MIARGDVVWCNFSPVVGSEQAGTRPAVIIQNDVANRTSPCTIVVPFTTKLPPTLFPSHAFVAAGVGGLTQDSIALCEQVRVVDKRRIIRVVGSLDASSLAAVDQALRMAMSL
jgi:mRNA interferase MazF